MLNQADISDKYLFATEYVEAEADIYDILSEYVDKEKLDMEAFKRGGKHQLYSLMLIRMANTMIP